MKIRMYLLLSRAILFVIFDLVRSFITWDNICLKEIRKRLRYFVQVIIFLFRTICKG
jgi:hypothetical protein